MNDPLSSVEKYLYDSVNKTNKNKHVSAILGAYIHIGSTYKNLLQGMEIYFETIPLSCT